MLKPYEKLSTLYDENWSQFSLKYLDVLSYLKEEYDVNPESILDIACGTGYLCSRLKHSYNVMGSDISEHMINIAQKNYPDIRFIISDMKDISIDKKFDLILCPFDSINYVIKENHIKKTIRRIYDLLTEKGYFLFDFNSMQLFTDLHKGIINRNVKGVEFKQILKYDSKSRRATTIFDFRDGVTETHIQKAYSFQEMKDYLVDNGFKILYTRDLFNNMQVTPNAYKILILAQK
ncbi:MAG: class I SAM-dependent methyltransferase [Spirochaetales bacterium]|nr:class I SAM-dependent methyltransferase [Spirochaetales bacterium]